MSIDMTGWQRLSAVGRDKQLSQLPRGGAPKGVQFAIKIKKAQWIDGQYVLDITVRTFDLSLILAGTVWKLWPSMLPDELQEALDCDDADGIWWLLETEENKKSKTNRTKFHLLDTQQGLDASGPPKPRAGGEHEAAGDGSDIPGPVPDSLRDTQPPATCSPLPSTELADTMLCSKCDTMMFTTWNACPNCGERVG